MCVYIYILILFLFRTIIIIYKYQSPVCEENSILFKCPLNPDHWFQTWVSSCRHPSHWSISLHLSKLHKPEYKLVLVNYKVGIPVWSFRAFRGHNTTTYFKIFEPNPTYFWDLFFFYSIGSKEHFTRRCSLPSFFVQSTEESSCTFLATFADICSWDLTSTLW